jgi:hypothetical protein
MDNTIQYNKESEMLTKMSPEKVEANKIDDKKFRATMLLALNEMIYKNNVVTFNDKQKVTNQIYKKYYRDH